MPLDKIIKTARQYLGVTPNGRNDNEMHGLFRTAGSSFCCSGIPAAITLRSKRYGKIITGMENLKKATWSFSSDHTEPVISSLIRAFIWGITNLFTSSSDGVTSSLDDPWWNERYLFGTRVFD
jgi:hypothetical protein